MNAFEFIVEFHEKYANKAAKNPRICGYYTALLKRFRNCLVDLESCQCSKEEREIVEMMVRECSIIKELAIQSGIAKSKK